MPARRGCAGIPAWNFIRRNSLGVHCPEMSHPESQTKKVAGRIVRPAPKSGPTIRWARFARKARNPRASQSPAAKNPPIR